jgi:hypothetical protein
LFLHLVASDFLGGRFFLKKGNIALEEDLIEPDGKKK